MKHILLLAIAALLAGPAQAVIMFDAFFDFDHPDIHGQFLSNGVHLQTKPAADGTVTAFLPVSFAFTASRVATRFAFDSSGSSNWFGRTRDWTLLQGTIAPGQNIIVPEAGLQLFYFGVDGHAKLDNLTISIIDGIPETQSWALLIAGLGATGWQLRRQQQRWGRGRIAA
jgi:hypothetical protein